MAVADLLGGLPAGTTIKVGGTTTGSTKPSSTTTGLQPGGATQTIGACTPGSVWDPRQSKCVPSSTSASLESSLSNTMAATAGLQPGTNVKPIMTDYALKNQQLSATTPKTSTQCGLNMTFDTAKQACVPIAGYDPYARTSPCGPAQVWDPAKNMCVSADPNSQGPSYQQISAAKCGPNMELDTVKQICVPIGTLDYEASQIAARDCAAVDGQYDYNAKRCVTKNELLGTAKLGTYDPAKFAAPAPPSPTADALGVQVPGSQVPAGPANTLGVQVPGGPATAGTPVPGAPPPPAADALGNVPTTGGATPPAITTPPGTEPTGSPVKTPSPFDNPTYYKKLSEDTQQVERQYFEGQKQMINQTFDEGWQQLEAELASGGYTYGTEMAEIKAIYDRDKMAATNKAYSEMMYTGIQRRMQEKQDAMNFYTNNKGMELEYAIGQGQLTMEMIKNSTNAAVAYKGIEADLAKAAASNSIARYEAETGRISAGIAQYEAETGRQLVRVQEIVANTGVIEAGIKKFEAETNRSYSEAIAGIQKAEAYTGEYRSITERIAALSMVDVNLASTYANYMTIAIEAGMKADIAEDSFNTLLAQYGGQAYETALTG